jgi:glycosyltransferase involved in cell wall biosynthesis
VSHAYDGVRGFDIVHDHTLLGPLLGRCEAAGRLVVTNHGPFTPEVDALYERLPPTAKVVAISQDQARRGTRVDAVIHHGIDVDTVPEGRGEGGYFLFLGRFHPDKGAKEAVLAARLAGVPLKLAAKMREPLEHAYFAAEVEPLLGGDVEYLGEVGADKKFELLGSARALVNPIQWPEPFGLVMIEALASGTPVLTYPQGAAPEIVDDGITGFFASSVPELASAMGRAWEIDRAACRSAASQRFSAQRMVDDHLALYGRMLQSFGRLPEAGGTSGRLSGTAAAAVSSGRLSGTAASGGTSRSSRAAESSSAAEPVNTATPTATPPKQQRPHGSAPPGYLVPRR